jgi:hypothetical protein
VKRLSLFLIATLAMVAIIALPAIAEHDVRDHNDPYDDYAQDFLDELDELEEDLQPYLDDRYDRYPPGYDVHKEPREPDCDWYGPYVERPFDAWWEYWCWWHGWGWEFVFWTWD